MEDLGEAARRLVAVCPEFSQAWRKHLDWWDGEPAGEYNDVAALAHWIVEQMAANNLDCFPALFGEVETTLEAAGPRLRDLLVVGLLEDIQNISAHGAADPDIALAFLGPESRMGWFELIRSWHGADGTGWAGQKREE